MNSDLGTIDITGHDFARKRQFRNVRTNPRAALVGTELPDNDPIVKANPDMFERTPTKKAAAKRATATMKA